MIVVDINGGADAASVTEALKLAPSGNETIFIKKGIYRERVEITVPNMELIGEDPESTVITHDLYANMKLENGEKRGTFRSYTMLVNTDNFTCQSLTVSNTAGFGKDVGQAVAVYAEGDNIRFENCRILGHQDTLFTGPLPYKEIEKGGFRGPTEFAERKQGRQFYNNCYIEGEVDFIFGSAAAFFDSCELHSLDRGEEINGYVTAASTYEGSQFGYVFTNCRFTGECAPESVYLGRPWRDHAKTMLINCYIGRHIDPEGFHDWNKTHARKTVGYYLYNCFGEGYDPKKLAPFVKVLSDEEAKTVLNCYTNL